MTLFFVFFFIIFICQYQDGIALLISSFEFALCNFSPMLYFVWTGDRNVGVCNEAKRTLQFGRTALLARHYFEQIVSLVTLVYHSMVTIGI